MLAMYDCLSMCGIASLAQSPINAACWLIDCDVLMQIPLAAMADGEASDSLSKIIKEHLLVLFLCKHCLLACLGFLLQKMSNAVKYMLQYASMHLLL